MATPPKTRASLILRLKTREDGLAWEEFTQLYRPLIYRIAVSRGLQPADANDITQEVMTRVAKSIRLFDPDSSKGSFRGWLSRITRNLVIEFMRNRNRLPKTSDDTAVYRIIQSKPDPGSESQMFDIEYERQLFAWAAEKVEMKFEPKTWQAFWQTAVKNKPVDEVASQLKISRGAIYVARSRVIAALKALVERTEKADGITGGQSE